MVANSGKREEAAGKRARLQGRATERLSIYLVFALANLLEHSAALPSLAFITWLLGPRIRLSGRGRRRAIRSCVLEVIVVA
jgi:hypothetical protein